MNTVLEQDERKGLPSASNWRRNELCAGSHQLSLEAKRLGQEAHSAPSEASAKGDQIHAWLAGEQVELKPTEQTSAELLKERADDQVKRIFGDEPVHMLIEERLWLKVDGHAIATGRVDRIVYSDQVALLQDYKTGFSEPDAAEQNSQLKMLSVLSGLRLEKVTKVVAQIISGPYGVTETTYDIPRLSEAYRDVRSTLRKINDPHAAFSPSEEACRWCPASNICQAVKDLVLPVAKLQYSALPDGERAAKLLDEINLLENHLSEIKAWYKRRLEDDVDYKIPGWGLVPGAPRRAVNDWVAAKSKLEEFIDGSSLASLATFSIPAVEKLLGESIGVKGSKLKEQFKAVLGDLLEEKFPEPSLKRVKGEPKVAEIAAP